MTMKRVKGDGEIRRQSMVSENGVYSANSTEDIDEVVIRFAGDSGDGIQVTGGDFSRAVARAGYDYSTLPDFPSEIRAPTGSLFGVSGYQIQYSSNDVFTPGDAVDVLVAMNPAALRMSLPDVRPSGLVIVNTSAFTEANITKAGYATDPIANGDLGPYRLVRIGIGELTNAALKDTGLSNKDIGRCKNYFALGIMLWLYSRPLEREIDEVQRKFAKKPAVAEANVIALRAGFGYAEAAELFDTAYRVRSVAAPKPGIYRSITGNRAAALGFVAAAELANVPLFLGSYPITPATDILHELAGLKNFQVTTFQAEDEIAAIGSCIGAAYGGALALTTTSGPGMALKTEALGLATMLELPLVVVNVQRGGPSTGLPTKIEQSDLLQALYGRNGECPIPVIAASTPADCFDCALEAFRLAVRYMTPVIMLSDGGIGNAAEPWLVPAIEALTKPHVHYRTDPDGFQPYERNEDLARPWVLPGTASMEHRIGGLEKDFHTGAISHHPANHESMVRVRAAKVAGIAESLPPSKVTGPDHGDLLLVGWGSTYGVIARAREELHTRGYSVAHLHIRHLNPLPADLDEILRQYKNILVPELNLGQLARILRERYLVDVKMLSKVQGKPFKVSEVVDHAIEVCW